MRSVLCPSELIMSLSSVMAKSPEILESAIGIPKGERP